MPNRHFISFPARLLATSRPSAAASPHAARIRFDHARLPRRCFHAARPPQIRSRAPRASPPRELRPVCPSQLRPAPPAVAPTCPVRPAPSVAPQLRPARLRPPPPPLRPHTAAAPPLSPLSDGAKKTPKGKSGFFGVRQKPSSNWGVEFFDAGRRWWIGTYPSAHEAACAYDVAVWRAERPREHLNFPEIESRVKAEMLVPQGIKMKEITTKKKTTKKPSVVVNAGETDEEAMATFAREHPEYVQAELEHYWKREAEQKKKEDEVGPSTVIPIESSFEEDWADFSEEEECDDPEKEEFWKQFRSSDDEEYFI
ncbi:hypothetical protein ZWY2020_048761 [Hordeum vulgare]|nr:hypothetical protein ZWY2020_048761 [Hordeum vulgare]